jgi:hypothetical protein
MVKIGPPSILIPLTACLQLPPWEIRGSEVHILFGAKWLQVLERRVSDIIL